MKVLTISLTLLLSISISGQNKNLADTIQGKSSEGVFTVRQDAVIFLWPDSAEYAEMEARYSEDDFVEIISDMNWYPMMASEVLDSLGIQHFDCNSDTIILSSGDRKQIILLRKKLDADMILFSPGKKPIYQYAIAFDEENIKAFFDLK